MGIIKADGEVRPDGSTANTTSSGDTVTTSDPSARPDASLGERLKGDLHGTMNMAAGSAQAAAGAAIFNPEMRQAGLEKMQAEDQRLGAKHGRLPVGSGLREKATGQPVTDPRPQRNENDVAH